ncbi:MAG: metallophosphoesterase, partial [Ignavibacteria bacterium]
VQQFDRSRRKFLRTTAFAFSSYAFAGAGYGILKHNKYIIEHQDIKINNLPKELKGLTLTLISDIHAGQYMTEDDMKKYAEVINEMSSDIICIPGDFVNFQVEDTASVARAFRDLKAKYGVYGTLGNHDFFVNADYIARVINNESPIKLLRNGYEKLIVNGRELFIIGVDDTRDSGGKMNRIVLENIDNTISSAKTNNQSFSASPKILLCHKPYAFDDMAKREIDLVLAGHTHGGQVVPFKFGDFNMSFAAFVSKYIEGLYTIGSANMYVSRGIGTVALPIRLNCPPEITKITLV